MGRLIHRELTTPSPIVCVKIWQYSTSLKPANTEKVKTVKMGQKDDKKDGGVMKEQKDYDGGNKKDGGAKKEQKDYDGGNKKEGDVKQEKGDGDKNKYDDKKGADKPDGYGSGYSNWNQEYDDCVQRKSSISSYFS